jgi:hypothetical protein
LENCYMIRINDRVAVRVLGYVTSVLLSMLSVSALAQSCAASDIPESPWGIAPGNVATSALANTNSWIKDIAPQTGIQWLRGGIPNITIYNNIVGAGSCLNVAGILFRGVSYTPPGGSVATAITFYSPTDPIWTSYLNERFTTFQGIKYWEVWNEPPGFNELGQRLNTPAEYKDIVVSARKAANLAGRTDVKLGLAARSNNLAWLSTTIDSAVTAGVVDPDFKIDFVTLHPYEIVGSLDRGFEGMYMSIVPTLRKMLAARGGAVSTNLPVWFTEFGAEAVPRVGEDDVTPEYQSDVLIKASTMGVAQGVAHLHWFEGIDAESRTYGLLGGVAGARTPRPSFYALQALISHLGKQPQYLGWVVIGKRYGFIFNGGLSGPAAGKKVLVTWAPEGVVDAVQLGLPHSIVNPRTGVAVAGTVVKPKPGAAPAIIYGDSPDLIALATKAVANKTRPFLWGGNFTASKFVEVTSPASINVGAQSIEKGLHWRTKRYTPLVIGTETVRDARESTAQLFTVDPNFLSYDKVKIRVTAQFRRNAVQRDPNVVPFFNFKYEGLPSPTSGATFRTVSNSFTPISDSTQWMTKSWIVDEPQFVGLFGDHFRFDSDALKFSEYSIRSVKIEKCSKLVAPTPPC